MHRPRLVQERIRKKTKPCPKILRNKETGRCNNKRAAVAPPSPTMLLAPSPGPLHSLMRGAVAAMIRGIKGWWLVLRRRGKGVSARSKSTQDQQVLTLRAMGESFHTDDRVLALL